MNVERKHIEI